MTPHEQVEYDDEPDALSPARGALLAVALSAPFWLLAGCLYFR